MLNRCPQITNFSKPVFYDSNAYQHVLRHEEDCLKHYDLDGVDIVGMKAHNIFDADVSTILYGIVTFNGDFNNAYNVLNFLKYFIYRIFTISCNTVEAGTSSNSNILIDKSNSLDAKSREDTYVEFYSVDIVDGVPQIIWPTISQKVWRMCKLLISPDYTFGQVM